MQVAAALVARMAEAGERAVATFEVSGADVIKDQAAFREVPFGESIFDALLPIEQPVEGAIELGFFDRIVQSEHGSQRGGGGFGMESAGGGQLGGGFENAGHDHGDDQITLGASGSGRGSAPDRGGEECPEQRRHGREELSAESGKHRRGRRGTRL